MVVQKIEVGGTYKDVNYSWLPIYVPVYKYRALVPDLFGCYALGDTVLEAIEKVKGVANAWLKEHKKRPAQTPLTEFSKIPRFRDSAISSVEL